MYDIYIVKDGDNIESIALKFKIPVYELMRLNNLKNIYSLKVGQKLKVPILNNDTSPFLYYTVLKGDTIYDIAKKAGITPKELLLLNGIGVNDYIYPNQKILLPKEGFSLYLTNMGDSLQSLGQKSQNSIDNLLKYNEQIYLLPNQIIVYRKRNQ